MRKNAKNVFCLVYLLILAMLLALSACKEEPAKTSKNDIISFEIGDVGGIFYQTEKNTIISLIVPAESDLSALTPVITVSDGATVSPASGVENNFTNPVTYTVTAENGNIRHFTVTVKAAEKTNRNDILSFKIGNAGGVFDNNTSISLIVPADSDLSALTPVITVSDGATVSPASGVENNFTNPVTYTVTAENGNIRHFTVTVKAAEKTPEGTLNLSVKLIANGDEDVTVYGIPEGGIVLAVSEKENLLNPNPENLPNKITISADKHTGVTWYIDNVHVAGGIIDNKNIITIDAKDYTLNQPHNITVIVNKNGINYSENISFTVIR